MTLGFGKDHDVLPVFKLEGKNGVKLQRFRCVVNEDNNAAKYYQAKALVLTEACVHKTYFSFTIPRKYLETLHDLDLERVDSRANRWDLPTRGDKRENCKS